MAAAEDYTEEEANFLNSITLGIDDEEDLKPTNDDNYLRVLTKGGEGEKYMGRVNAICNRLDKNNDGTIEYNEIKEIDLKGHLLQKADKDKNGELSHRELRMWFDKKALNDMRGFVKYVVYLEKKLKLVRPPTPKKCKDFDWKVVSMVLAGVSAVAVGTAAYALRKKN
eukprot:TRINITY_DN842_c0_g1_i1.p1 TRINITY_DN842_c0_g1~~TRINITY_DN842_c0_g1_i1.p1  ORF type:complete len:168 (-),score=63.43 TRINITY_DN842_c0_g1_i1:154-657(-)